MCPTTDYDPAFSLHHHHFHLNHPLKFTNFTINLSLSSSSSSSSSFYLPDILSLLFLPRINTGRLEINGYKVRPDSPAFLTLHRTISPSSDNIVYSTNDRLLFSDSVVFEVHVGEVRLLKGLFRKDGTLQWDWRVECKCMVDEREFVGVKLKEVEVCVGEENDRVLMREKVVVEKRMRRRRRKGFQMGLVEIPEERESDVEDREVDVEEDCMVKMMESEMEGVKWAIDVGIWVACLGLGLLVSRASVRSLRRRKLVV